MRARLEGDVGYVRVTSFNEQTDIGLESAIAKLRADAKGKTERDRKVVIDRAPRFGIVGKDQVIAFHVEEVNGENQPVEVTLRFGRGEPFRHGIRREELDRLIRFFGPVDRHENTIQGGHRFFHDQHGT